MLTTTHRYPGILATGHRFEVPLDHARPGGEQITVYARELVCPTRAEDDLPHLVYLQGGPGFASPRPSTRAGWIKEALKDHRVLLVDQRGTGNSSPICHRTLVRLGSPEAQAAYLSHFRADAIVSDLEHMRGVLLGQDTRWSLLGQSFGGFCAVRYLSAAPEGLSSVLITGGLPPLTGHADQVYAATYRRVMRRNDRYYKRYPEDEALVCQIVDHLCAHPTTLPGGTRLTPRVFQQLGMRYGMSDAFEMQHFLLETAFIDGPDGPELSHRFLRGIENRLPFDTNPIYAILHEAIYCQGEASRWSAYRVGADLDAFHASGSGRLNFTGEMVYPWMFADYHHLAPLAEAADILAEKDDWPMLYDLDALKRNTVPCAAVIYDDDMYVERALSSETADAIGNTRTWVTNEFDHNGLGVDGARILRYLQDLNRGLR